MRHRSPAYLASLAHVEDLRRAAAATRPSADIARRRRELPVPDRVGARVWLRLRAALG